MTVSTTETIVVVPLQLQRCKSKNGKDLALELMLPKG